VCTPIGSEVLDRADDDAVVLAVADDLHLELFPAEERLLDQELVRRRERKAAPHISTNSSLL
jgi:hypothetical protein